MTIEIRSTFARAALAPLIAALITAAGCGGGGSAPPVDAGKGGAGGADAGHVDGGGGAGGSDAHRDASSTMVSYTFDTDLQGFAFDLFQSPDPGAVVNLAVPRTIVDAGGTGGSTGSGGAGGGAGGGSGGVVDASSDANGDGHSSGNGVAVLPTLEFDSTVGNPQPGSAKVTVPFTDFNQVVDVAKRFLPPLPLLDLTGRTLRVKVRLTSGTFSGGAVVYVVATTAYIYSASTYTLLLSNEWRELTLDLTNVPNADQIIGFGVQFGSGGGAFDGSTFTPTTPVFNVDTLVD